MAPTGYRADDAWSASFTITESGKTVDLTNRPVSNDPIALAVPLEATKTFDGASQGLTLEQGMFSFELRNQAGRVLQTKTNDATGKIVFDALSFDYADLDSEHVYTIREVVGDNGLITYDTHVETVRITLGTKADGSLEATVKTDDDGLTFHNETISELDLPVTGQRGVVWAIAGSSVVLSVSSVALYRLLGKHGRL